MSFSDHRRSASLGSLMYLGLAALILVASALGGAGLFGMHRILGGLDSVYEDRVVPLRDLKQISDAYAVDVVDGLNKARLGTLTPGEAATRLRDAQRLIRDKWQAYRATRLTPAEERLIARLEPLMSEGNRLAEQAQGALGSQDRTALDTLVAQALYPTIEPITQTLNELVDVQLDAAHNDYEQYHALYNRLQGLLITAIVLAAIASALAAGWFIRARITQPLEEVGRFARRIADGDLSLSLTMRHGDEIGRLTEAMGGMRDALRQIVELIHRNAERIASASEQLSGTTRQISQAAEEQSQSASSMAAAVEQMTVSINHVADFANDASKLASESGTASREGAEVIHNVVTDIRRIAQSVDETAGAIRTLGEHSKEIASVVNVIKEVADQTNLLALNAAIEAARAGEQGRGFAVVADEVRKLAERTAASTQDIGRIVNLITQGTDHAVKTMEHQVGNVRNGVELAARAGEAIGRINAASERVVGAVNEISTALGEQSSASNDIAQNVEKIAGMGEENSAAVHETASAAEHLAELAAQLQQATARFRT